jgi:hypothetical protein
MPLYPLGISRSRDVPPAAEPAVAGQIAVGWVPVGQLAAALLDLPQAPPNPMQHAAALEAIHRRICVLPMRFGSGPHDEAAIRSLLRARHRELLQRLDYLEGTCEMGLRIAIPIRHTPQVDPLPRTSSPAAYLEHRRAHYQRRDSLDQQARLAEERVLRELQGTYREWRRLAPAPPGLARLAFLVERELAASFEGRVKASAAECSLQQTLLGPWPPYSFV